MFIVSKLAALPRKTMLIVVAIVVVFIAVGATATALVFGSSGPSAAPAPVSAPSTTTTPSADPGQQCVASGGMWNGSSCLTESPTPSATSLTGAVGTTFTITSDNGTSYDVTLDQVMQHATLGQYDSLNNSEDHVAAAQFTITGDAGSSSDDAYSDANAIGSDQVEYESTFVIESLPEFSSGTFQVSPGQTEKGWVTFELPPNATVAQVQWAPGDQAATWTVGS